MNYAQLRAEVRAAGLLERTPTSYLRVAATIGALAAVWLPLVLLAPIGYHVLAAPVLSLFWIQVGFVGHDAGHNQVFPRSAANRNLGLLCFPLILGMSFRPWVIRHNLHHARSNVVGADPDLDNKVLAFTAHAAASARGVRRWIVRHQAYVYPLLGLLATVAFRIDAWRYAIGADTVRYPSQKYRDERRLELALLCVWVVLWLVVPAVFLSPQRWLPVFVVAQLLLGCHLSWVFAPNHKGMPVFQVDARPTFLTHQVLTSRNVTGGWLVDFMYGGLNYQIEHHLFPTMPRTHLAACRRIVRARCAAAAIQYVEESPLAILGSVLRSLDEVGRGA